MGSLIRRITGIKDIFNSEKTAPSYIPSDTFAASLIDTLQLQELMQTISEYKLRRLIMAILMKSKKILNELNIEDEYQKGKIQAEFEQLHKKLAQSLQEYQNDLANLDLTLDRILDMLNLYSQKSLEYLPEITHSEFINKMTTVTQVLTNSHDKKVLVRKIEPSFSNLLKFLEKAIAAGKEGAENFPAQKTVISEKIIHIVNLLPKSLQNSLYILAKQARTKTSQTGDALYQFQKEIETWFEHGMERAAGVYKRNARGVALLIGITIAVVVNIDALNIIDSLSKDSLMRQTIAVYSEELVTSNSEPSELEIGDIQNQVSAALEDLELPIGWVQQPINTRAENQSFNYLQGSKKILGWLISGMAISMGADFWFNLLKRFFQLK